jgi:cytochrome b
MSKVLVWDLPTRVFHVVLAVGFVVAYSVAELLGSRSAWFPYHMMVGLTLAAAVLLRAIWGFVGTRHARWQELMYRPTDVLAYLWGAVTRTAPRSVGHNPGSSYAILAMLALTLLAAVSGLLVTRGYEEAEEVHEVAANGLLIVVLIHVCGVVWHSWRHRENITLGMITGYKEGAPSDAIASSRPLVAGLFAGLVLATLAGMVRNYDVKSRTTSLPFVGTQLRLGEELHERRGPERGRE